MKNEETMKINTHQTIFEVIQNPQDEGWNDSKLFESIQHKSESFHDTIQTILNWFRCDKTQKHMKWFT